MVGKRWQRACAAGLMALSAGCAPWPATTWEVDHGAGRLRAERGQDGVCRLQMSGRIDAEFEAAFTRAVAHLERGTCTAWRVELDSGGGIIGPSLRVGQMIRDRRMTTEIAAGGTTRCASACGFLFIAGVERLTKPRASSEPASRELGLHQASRRLDGQKLCSTEETIRPTLARRLKEYVHAMLPPAGAERMLQVMMDTDCRRMQYLEAEEMIRLGIATG